MWPFKKIENLSKSGTFKGFTDWHSHILPGVDDGIAKMEHSLALLKRYEELGIKKVWLTPHIMEDYPNTPEKLKESFNSLKENWKGNVELALAAEHMLDNLFEERLAANEVMPIGSAGKHVLVETSYFNPPMGLENIFDRILSAGYFPIFAHPERYQYMSKDDYKRYRDKGVMYQMNLASIAGAFGKTAQGKAEWLLEKNMIDLTGTDVHRLQVFENMILTAPRKQKYLEKAVEIAHNPALV